MATLLPGNIIYAGPITDVEYPKFRSLGHFITEKLKSFGDKILLIDGITGREYSAKEIYLTVIRLAYVLRKLGVKSGDVVSISSENRYEAAIATFATIVLNAIIAPLNNSYAVREIHHAVNLFKPKVIFASKQTIESVMKTAKQNAFIKHIIMFDLPHSNSKVHSYKELMKDSHIVAQKDFFCNFANKDDVAVIVCSSGTTGLPKGVQLTQLNIMAACGTSEIECTSVPLSQQTVLAVLPFFHVFGLTTLIAASIMGTTLVCLPKFEPHSFLRSIEKYGIKMVFMVPPLMVFLAKHPIVDKYNLSSLDILYCGAAPLSKETEDQIKKRLGVPIIRQGYGLSETTRGVMIQNDDFCKSGSVGKLKKGLYAKVVDPDTNKTLGANQRGELCFKGDYIMKGYIGDEKSTKAIIEDGWLRSGDIGYFDKDLEFFVVDRLKELIKYKGYQVPPAEIEALLLTMSKIKDAAVIGKPDERAGELPLAFVVKQPDVELTETEIINFVADRTSIAKRLHGGVVFIDEIPKNPSGKILRRVLRDMLKNKSKL